MEIKIENLNKEELDFRFFLTIQDKTKIFLFLVRKID